MKRNIAIAIITGLLCFFTAGSLADDQPEKRVMSFIAVMDLKCGKGIEKEQCAALTEILIGQLTRTKRYTVIDRANRDKILGEAGFQMTGCVDESCTIEAGRIMGVGKIIVGSITQLGKTYLVNLQLLNVETAAVEVFADQTCKKCELDDLINTVKNASRKLMGEKIISESEVKQPPKPPELKVEKIIRYGIDPHETQFKEIVRGDEIAHIQNGKIAYKNITFIDGRGRVKNQLLGIAKLTAPKEYFWEIVLDIEGYKKNLKWKGKNKLVKKTGNNIKMWYKYKILWMEFESVWDMNYEEEKEMLWWQMDSKLKHSYWLKDFSGFIKLVDFENNITAICYSFVMDIEGRTTGEVNSTTIEKQAVEQNMKGLVGINKLYDKRN